uniref:Pentatricopeptide repeat-containing protein At3g29230 n=1 Tax=Anthurium amnicola TaxID=1678845 RepID=A0A1D1Z109_9ARAE
MAAGPRPSPARPSSLYLDRLLATCRNRSRGFPTTIWRDADGDAGSGVGEPPALRLSHPVLRALEARPCAGLAFDQALAQLLVSGLLQHPLAAGRAVRSLCSSGSPSSATRAVELFSHLDEPDAFVCNTILRAYARAGDPRGGLCFYRGHMLRRRVPPNHYTFPLLAKLCADAGSGPEGARTHALAMKMGFELDLFVRNSLIHMYSSFGRVESARFLFDLPAESDLVTWNSMIDGYVKKGMVETARGLFDEMPGRDVLSWNVMIAGHAGVGDVKAARWLFDTMPERDSVSWNSIIDGYGKAGEVKVAREIFDAMPSPNVVLWNTILAIYVRAKDYRECLRLFDWMMTMGVRANEATLVSVLISCSSLGELDRGKWVHSYIKSRNRDIEPDVLLSTALLTMYSKCGEMDSAREIFDQMAERSVVSWNSMIAGYGKHGYADKAITMFLEMEKEGPRPNEATFVCLLSACVHAALVFEGWWCFDRMVRRYDIEPKIEHYGCMVDLLGRAGLLSHSKELMENMPMQPSPALMGALLSACKTHSNLKVGEIVGIQLMELDPRDVGPYVLLSDIYAAEGRWVDVEKVRTVMRDEGLLKGAGVSLVGSENQSVCLVKHEGPVHKKGIMYSILNEMDAQMKASHGAFGE